MYETRAMGAEHTRPVDLLQRQLGFRAYKVVTGEDPAGQPAVMGDVALVYTDASINRSFVDGPMLPIEEI